MISPENANLNKIKLKTLIDFIFQYILFYTLLAIFFLFIQKVKEEYNTDWSRRRDKTYAIFRILFSIGKVILDWIY